MRKCYKTQTLWRPYCTVAQKACPQPLDIDITSHACRRQSLLMVRQSIRETWGHAGEDRAVTVPLRLLPLCASGLHLPRSPAPLCLLRRRPRFLQRLRLPWSRDVYRLRSRQLPPNSAPPLPCILLPQILPVQLRLLIPLIPHMCSLIQLPRADHLSLPFLRPLGLLHFQLTFLSLHPSSILIPHHLVCIDMGEVEVIGVIENSSGSSFSPDPCSPVISHGAFLHRPYSLAYTHTIYL